MQPPSRGSPWPSVYWQMISCGQFMVLHLLSSLSKPILRCILWLPVTPLGDNSVIHHVFTHWEEHSPSICSWEFFSLSSPLSLQLCYLKGWPLSQVLWSSLFILQLFLLCPKEQCALLWIKEYIKSDCTVKQGYSVFYWLENRQHNQGFEKMRDR